jgi:hypothetical protein
MGSNCSAQETEIGRLQMASYALQAKKANELTPDMQEEWAKRMKGNSPQETANQKRLRKMMESWQRRTNAGGGGKSNRKRTHRKRSHRKRTHYKRTHRKRSYRK